MAESVHGCRGGKQGGEGYGDHGAEGGHHQGKSQHGDVDAGISKVGERLRLDEMQGVYAADRDEYSGQPSQQSEHRAFRQCQ